MVSQDSQAEFCALVTDDDPIVCRMLSFALAQEGFACDSAFDGEHALALLGKKPYDLLVTDLHMPNKNGHALAVELLESQSRPVIMVHTSVEEPLLTKDLMIRGVDDISYKPTNYGVLAAKARGLAVRRREIQASDNQPAASPGQDENQTTAAPPNTRRIPPDELEQRLAELDVLFPLSHVAFDVYSQATQPNTKTDELAAVIEQDASLTTEVLKLANSSHCSPGLNEIDSVEKAIVRLGLLRIGELALAAGGRQALASCSIPWIDRDRLWKRSVAAGIALRTLEGKRTAGTDGSAFLSTILHPVGRIVLATLFPEEHRTVIERCAATGEALDVVEAQTFGLSYGQVGARLLSAWGIQTKAKMPLEQITRGFDDLTALPERYRNQVQAVKLSVLLSRIAMCLWESWDAIDLPRLAQFESLNTPAVPEILAAIRNGCDFEIVPYCWRQESAEGASAPATMPETTYVSRIDPASDLLRPLLESLGVPLAEPSPESSQPIFVDGLTAGGHRLSKLLATWDSADLLGVVRTEEDSSLFPAGAAVHHPTTVQNLLQLCSHSQPTSKTK